MKRRPFLAGGLAAGTVFFGETATAHQTKTLPDYNLPDDLLPRIVPTASKFLPNEVHVKPDEFSLYWTLPGNQALRYIVGVARPNLYEPGEYFVGARKEWPHWTPTPGMLRREPNRYGKWKGGMRGGLNNPLGARALYLFTPTRGDTLLRIHGTNDPSTLAQRVSNGCARLVNDQMVDLYNRVPLNTKVVLHPSSS